MFFYPMQGELRYALQETRQEFSLFARGEGFPGDDGGTLRIAEAAPKVLVIIRVIVYN
jgi:hypothetical protein